MSKYKPASLVLTPAWNGLKQQILHLAQFGGSMQVIQGARGAGKSTFCAFVSDEDLGSPLISLTVKSDESPETFFLELVTCLGLKPQPSASFGELIACLRGYVQSQRNDRSRVVVAVDDAHLLTEAALAALISVLQGSTDSGVGLHLVFFSEPGLAEVIDSLNLLDVSVHDSQLPSFSPSELKSLLMHHFSTKPDHFLVSAEQIHSIWVESKGLPGRAITQARALRGSNRATKPFFSFGGIPLLHFGALFFLSSILIWFFVLRGEGSSNPQTVTQLSVDEGRLERSSPPVVGAMNIDELNAERVKESIVQGDLSGKTSELNGVRENGSKTPIKPERIQRPPVVVASTLVDSEVTKLKSVNDNKLGKQLEGSEEVKLGVKESKPKKSLVLGDVEPVASPKEILNKTSLSSGLEGISKDEKRILAFSESGYVLQIMALADLVKLRDYQSKQPNRNNLLIYKAERKGRIVYILLEGFYADKQSALMAIMNLPKKQQKGGPWPKSLKLVQKEIEDFRRR